MNIEERVDRLERNNRRLKGVNLLLALLLVAGATLAMDQEQGVQEVLRAKRIEIVGKNDTSEGPDNIILLSVSPSNRGIIRINSPANVRNPVVMIDSDRISLHDDDGMRRFSASKNMITLNSSIGKTAFSVNSGSMRLCDNKGNSIHLWRTSGPQYKISGIEGKATLAQFYGNKLTLFNYDGEPIHSFESDQEGGSYQLHTPDSNASASLSVNKRNNNTPELKLKRSKKEKKINHWRDR